MEIKSVDTNLAAAASSIKPEQQNSLSGKQNPSINERENDSDRDDRINISTAAQRLSSAVKAGNNSANVQNRQQAEQISQNIQKTFQVNPNQAISAQANIAAASIKNLLG